MVKLNGRIWPRYAAFLLAAALPLALGGCRREAGAPVTPAGQEFAARKAERPVIVLFMSSDAPIPPDVMAAVEAVQQTLKDRVDVIKVQLESDEEGLAKKHGVSHAPSIALVGGKSGLTVRYVGISSSEARKRVVAELKRLAAEGDVTPTQ